MYNVATYDVFEEPGTLIPFPRDTIDSILDVGSYDPFDSGESERKNRKRVTAFRSKGMIDDVAEEIMKIRASKDVIRFRNLCLFVVGCNVGLRAGDLLRLKWRHLVDEEGKVVTLRTVREKKNKNFKKIYLNEAARGSIELYKEVLEKEGRYDLDDYLFVSYSGRTTKDKDGRVMPLTIENVEAIIRDATKNLGLYGIQDRRYSSHSMRKTFLSAAFGIVDGVKLSRTVEYNMRQLEYVRAIAGHKSSTTTIRYLDLNDLMDEETYMSMNLGVDIVRKYKRARGV